MKKGAKDAPFKFLFRKFSYAVDYKGDNRHDNKYAKHTHTHKFKSN